jgi:HemY protein
LARWLPSFKTLIKLIILAGLVFLVALYPGDVHLNWLGYVVDLPVAAVLAVILVILGVCIFFYHTWRYIQDLPQRVRRVLAQRRYQKGERLLLEGLTAIAAQQPEEAAECVEFAKTLLPDHPLTVFVAAQSAHLANDHQRASEYFYEMTRNPRLSFLGYRGLIVQAQERKDWRRALELLSQAFHLRPDSPWVIQETLKTHIMLSQVELITEQKALPVYRYISKENWRRHEALSLFLQTNHLSCLLYTSPSPRDH